MKSTAQKYSGHQKQCVREKILTHKKVYKNIVLLPGEHCRDVKFMLAQKAINSATTITVIERDLVKLNKIKVKFKKYPFKKVHFFHGQIEDCPDYGPYDLVNLDTCSTLSREILDWIASIQFCPNGELAVWLTAYRHRQSFKDSLFNSFFGTKIGLRTVRDMKDQISDFSYRPEQVHTVTAAAIYTALNKYSCSVLPVIAYCEHVNFMYVYKFNDINRILIPRPDLNEVLVELNESHSQTWSSNKSEFNLANDKLMTMLIKVNQNLNSGQRSYITRQLRGEITNGQIIGKSPIMIKAGWKSYISKIFKEDIVSKNKIHEFINGV